ncbi:MAG: hypothetical protein SCK70_07210 [bacterium]|nr:hypothetical protein [bacterium]
MKHKNTICVLVICMVIIAGLAAGMGIFSKHGPGSFEYQSIRGKTVSIYGKGIYQHMSAEVAVQGIAQDYVTFFIGIPLLLIALFWAAKGSLKARFLLVGTLGYFLVTYLFYTAMGMYNVMFLGYVFLLGTSFFAFTLTMVDFDLAQLPSLFRENTPVRFAGGFLIFNTIAIALLWLSIVVPPLIDGTIFPAELEHYTTLIVQGFDLGLLLPIAFVSGLLLIRRKPFGFLLVPVYFVFLSLLMTALTAKIIAMALAGVNVFPVVIIIPAFNLTAILCSIVLLKNLIEPQTVS